MATLILGTVGRIVAGPIGAIVGTLVGSTIDRAVLGGGRPREQGRISNPAVQSATYGEPIPLVVGRMRTAGNLIWTSGIRESTTTSGGGKRSGPATTNYSYSASFAVGLVGRRIAGVERIWADGKLIRDAGGAFVSPTMMRLHDGDADQPLDPLIAAAESIERTPAYRGLAYAVFEDLPLADYGNRIPNLTFEVVADAATADIGDVVIGLAAAAGFGDVAIEGSFPSLSGYIAARAGSLGEALAPLLAGANASIIAGTPLRIVGQGGMPALIAADAQDAHRPGDTRPSERHRLAAADSQPAGVELAFYDVSRDYQPGLQRARRSGVPRVDQQSIAAAMTPTDAKALAFAQLAASVAGRSQRSVRLAWRHLGIAPGAVVCLAGDMTLWRVREARFEDFIVHLALEGLVPTPAVPMDAAVRRADGGRALPSEIVATGPTVVRVLDLPALPGDLPTAPRLWIAASGPAPGWRRSDLAISLDGGESFAAAGSLEGGTVIGSTLSVLSDGSCAGWDRHGSVDVELLADRDWLERRTAAAVLAGANLALVGNELIQFAEAEPIGVRRFRLHGLLRGRRGTEAATAGHAVGEAFVMVDPQRLLPVDFPLESLDRHGLVRPAGVDDGDHADVAFVVGSAALRPLSPVHLRATVQGNDIAIGWIRRSRAGFGWADFVDAPLGEVAEVYRVEVQVTGRTVRQVLTTAPSWRYTDADWSSDGAPAEIGIAVAQVSEAVGPGARAVIQFKREGQVVA